MIRRICGKCEHNFITYPLVYIGGIRQIGKCGRREIPQRWSMKPSRVKLVAPCCEYVGIIFVFENVCKCLTI